MSTLCICWLFDSWTGYLVFDVAWSIGYLVILEASILTKTPSLDASRPPRAETRPAAFPAWRGHHR